MSLPLRLLSWVTCGCNSDAVPPNRQATISAQGRELAPDELILTVIEPEELVSADVTTLGIGEFNNTKKGTNKNNQASKVTNAVVDEKPHYFTYIQGVGEIDTTASNHNSNETNNNNSSMDNAEVDCVMKVCLVGDSDTGKSSFLLQWIHGEFKENIAPTIGVDFHLKRVIINHPKDNYKEYLNVKNTHSNIATPPLSDDSKKEQSVGSTVQLENGTVNNITSSSTHKKNEDATITQDEFTYPIVSKVTLWDTAGMERFRTLVSYYYRGAQLVILMFDLTNRQSFETLSLWMNEIFMYSTGRPILTVDQEAEKERGGDAESRTNNRPLPMVALIGNKTDLIGNNHARRVVSREEVEAWMSQQSTLPITQYFETSSKYDREGIALILRVLVERVIHPPRQDPETTTQAGVEAGVGAGREEHGIRVQIKKRQKERQEKAKQEALIKQNQAKREQIKQLVPMDLIEKELIPLFQDLVINVTNTGFLQANQQRDSELGKSCVKFKDEMYSIVQGLHKTLLRADTTITTNTAATASTTATDSNDKPEEERREVGGNNTNITFETLQSLIQQVKETLWTLPSAIVMTTNDEAREKEKEKERAALLELSFRIMDHIQDTEHLLTKVKTLHVSLFMLSFASTTISTSTIS